MILPGFVAPSYEDVIPMYNNFSAYGSLDTIQIFTYSYLPKLEKEYFKSIDSKIYLIAPLHINLVIPSISHRSYKTLFYFLHQAKRLGLSGVITRLGFRCHKTTKEIVSYNSAVKNLVSILNKLDIPDGIELLLKNSSGSKSNLGFGSVSDFCSIYHELPEKVAFNIDTCCCYANGDCLSSSVKVLQDKISVFNLNLPISDCKFGDFKDRHLKATFENCLDRDFSMKVFDLLNTGKGVTLDRNSNALYTSEYNYILNH